MRSKLLWIVTLAAAPATAALLGACGDEPANGAGGAPSMTSSVSTSTGATVSSSTGGGDTACAVLAVLEAKCWSCHGTTPLGGAPEALVTHEQLTAPSAADAALSYAERAVGRMKSSTAPMPPGPGSRSTAEDVAAFEAWIAAGSPKGSCAVAADPYAAPSQCTSGMMWNVNNQEGPDMRPGNACITCHADTNATSGDADAPIFSFAGTLFATAHEPNDCIAPGPAGAKVELTDANGKVVVVEPNATGNFSYEADDFAYPYTAKVLYQGRERAMTAPQKDGDCNSCHTPEGINGAPGRILLP